MNEIIGINTLTAEQNQQLMKLLALLNGNPQSYQQNYRRITVKQALQRYLQINESTLSISSRNIVKAAYNHFTNYFGNDSFLDEIMFKELIIDFRTYLYSTLKIKSNTYWKHLRSLFNDLSELNYFQQNYFNDVKPPRFQEPEILSIDRKQLEQIRQNTSDLFADIFLLTWLNGFRLAEIINLTYSQINFRDRIITIGSQHFITKSKRIRKIPFNEESYKLLLKYRPKIFHQNKLNYVLEKARVLNSVRIIYQNNLKIRLKSGLDNRLKFHSLRSSYASNLSEKGVPVPTIQKLLGHTDISVTMKYVRVDLESLREAVDTLNNSEFRSKNG